MKKTVKKTKTEKPVKEAVVPVVAPVKPKKEKVTQAMLEVARSTAYDQGLAEGKKKVEIQKKAMTEFCTALVELLGATLDRHEPIFTDDYYSCSVTEYRDLKETIENFKKTMQDEPSQA